MIQEGDKVPSFSLESDAGKKLSNKDFAGSPWVLYFYPKDSTPGCTREAQAFTAQAAAFKKLGARVVGVSKDSVASHCTFRDKYELGIPLLSDPDLVLHKAIGAWGEKSPYGRKFMGTIRCTFVIGKDGKVAKAYPSVKVDGHAEKVLDVLRELATGKPAAAAAKAKTSSSTAAKKAAKGAKKKAAPKAKR